LAAVENLVKVDAARGIKTRLVCIDDDTMRRLGGRISSRSGLCSVEDKEQQREAKEAVDFIASSLSPDFIALLDGPDVIPHITLDNPNAPHDFFQATVPSDLPYASSAGYSSKVSDFLNVTRLVSRIPNATGHNDPNPVIRCLNTSAKFEPGSISEYLSYFALCSPEFKGPIREGINIVFGEAKNLDVVPPAGLSNTNTRFARRSHFINCHGDDKTPEFYGGKGSGQALEVAMTSSQVASETVEGTLVVSECCYGAQLYDPKDAGGAVPICISYIAGGCVGFLGSTNIAFAGLDPSVPFGGADHLVSSFFKHVLGGASLGVALAKARQDFIKKQMMSEGNLKALAQFILLGDPSTTPCRSPGSEGRFLLPEPELAKVGQAIAEAVWIPSETGSVPDVAAWESSETGSVPDALMEKVRARARERGYKTFTETVTRCSRWGSAPTGPPDAKAFIVTIWSQPETFLIKEQTVRTRYRYIAAYIFGGEIDHFEEAASH
jgi:hypothetical protein